jgi:hypothetical protein
MSWLTWILVLLTLPLFIALALLDRLAPPRPNEDWRIA